MGCAIKAECVGQLVLPGVCMWSAFEEGMGGWVVHPLGWGWRAWFQNCERWEPAQLTPNSWGFFFCWREWNSGPAAQKCPFCPLVSLPRQGQHAPHRWGCRGGGHLHEYARCSPRAPVMRSLCPQSCGHRRRITQTWHSASEAGFSPRLCSWGHKRLWSHDTEQRMQKGKGAPPASAMVETQMPEGIPV